MTSVQPKPLDYAYDLERAPEWWGYAGSFRGNAFSAETVGTDGAAIAATFLLVTIC